LRMRYYNYTRKLRVICKHPVTHGWRIVSTAVQNRIRWMIHGKSELQRIHEQVYWPDKNFVPPKIAARISLVRVPQQYKAYVADPLLGWGTRTTAGVEVLTVKGQHFFMLREPAVQEVAKVLLPAMDRARLESPIELERQGHQA
jgi:thioesterase domain-containing protein